MQDDRQNDAQIFLALRRLARTGAYILKTGPSSFAIEKAQAHGLKPLGAVAASIVMRLVRERYVAPLPALQELPPRLVIAPAGRSALKNRTMSIEVAPHDRAEIEQRAIRIEGSRAVTAIVNVSESPLGWLRSRQSGRCGISETEFEAGERLREDYTRGQMAPRVTADWGRPMGARGGTGGIEVLEAAALAARTRVHAAMAAVGFGLSEVLFSVCCELKGIGAVEEGQGWPQRSAKVVLKIALNRLARHYGMISDNPHTDYAQVRRGIRIWRSG